MNNITIIHNPYDLPDAGRVVEWRGKTPARIQLATGLTLRLSESTGLYVPED